MFGIVDCNNFFVSCERVFQPSLENKPVLVLSSNDGCVISRSNEVKALNIGMGQPFFKIKPLVKQYKIQVFSSNFTLYRDMSQKVMDTVAQLMPNHEIYSIDEAFLALDGFSPTELFSRVKKTVEIIQQWTGIPTTIGIGPTKTLAKLANKIAKKQRIPVFDITDPFAQQFWLPTIAVEDIWGIGSAWKKQLNDMHIFTAATLQKKSITDIKRRFGQTLASTVAELQGEVHYPLQADHPPKKQIIVSRSFGHPLTTWEPVSQALAYHAARAMEKLRGQQSLVKQWAIFVETSRFVSNQQSYRQSRVLSLPYATRNTSTVIADSLQALKEIFKAGRSYKKAGIILLDIVAQRNRQLDFFSPSEEKILKGDKIMHLMDSVNKRMGSQTLYLAAQGHKPPFVQNARRSCAYTSSWKELMAVT